MHPTNFALLLMLATVGCIPSGKGPADIPATSPIADTAVADTTPPKVVMRSNVTWRALSTDPSTLVFGTGDTLHMHAKDLRSLTQLTAPSGKPWFIFSGIDVGTSNGQRSIYVVSPGDSLSKGIQQSWHMPGRLIDSTSAAPYYEASVFAGEVLRDTIGVVWYDRSLMPDGQWRLNTTVLRLGSVKPDTIVLFGQGRKSATIDLAVKGKCLSLLPLDQRTASH